MNNAKHHRSMLSRWFLSAVIVTIFSPAVYAQSVIEYFWNEDPGIGHGTIVKQTGNDSSGSDFTIDASNLRSGINLLGMRANQHGKWSHTIYRLISGGDTSSDDWDVEYFWNNDPGIGKATPVSLSAPDGDNLMSMTLDTSHLKPGLNILGIRANSGSVLSSTRTYIINISPAGDDKCVVEYFWDNDPGCGKATPIPEGAIDAGTLVEMEIPYNGLTPGAHTLGIRSLSSYGWSATYTNTVYVAGEKGPGCTYAEYFWGEDPGYGKGTPIDIKPGDEVSVDELTIDFPTEVADEYVLSFRSRSDNGWSTTVTKILPHLYIEEIAIEADTTIMTRGTSMQLRGIVTPTDAFDDRITWSSSDDNVLTVDNSGLVKAVGAGKATVTAKAEDAHGVTGSIDIEVIVPVEGISIEPAELKLSVTNTHKLTAKVTPEDATYTEVTWSCEGDAVTVDEEGNITAIARGEAIVTATATDGTGISGSCKVTVGYLMGDADDDGTLAVNDVVLTARGVVDDIDQKLVMEAVDMNSDGMLTVGDLALVAKSVIEWNPLPASIPAQKRVAPEYGNILLVPEPDGETVAVYVESGISVTGLQFDVEASEGVNVNGITSASETGFSTENHAFTDGRTRHLSYSVSTNALPGNVPAAYIHLTRTDDNASEDAMLEVSNAMASDFFGYLYSLGSAWTKLETSSSPEISAEGISVTTEGRTVIVTVPDDRYITFSDMKGVSRRMSMTKGINRFEVPAGGVYAVDGIKIIIK
ncbi:MAG: Ig-like domain-containing protein [Muribaculaceae bacterium]|nr:Ig-like domain-containing protein [Muribaculaceae bacterium]